MIARRVGVSRPTVIACRRRYVHRGLAGLPRSAPARTTPDGPSSPPGRDLVGHPQPATATAGDHPLVDPAARPRAGRQPRQPSPASGASTASSPGGPRPSSFHRPAADGQGPRRRWALYLHPPERAVVLCVDEKSQIQALERTQPVRGVRPGRPEQRTHDYILHGTTSLFAALEVATGRVLGPMPPPPPPSRSSWRSSSRSPAPSPRRRQVICDQYATHKHPVVRGWLAKYPRVQLRFTPTSASVAEPGRGVLLDHRSPGASPWQLRQRHRSHRRDRSVLPELERALPALLLDQARRPDPRQTQP